MENYRNWSVRGENITELSMPLSDRELLIVMLEPDKEVWAELPLYTPFSDDDELIKMDGEWTSEFIPTMNNKYGDWRLPAHDGYIGPEARELEYCYCYRENEIPEKAEWKTSTYSYGTYFHIAEGEVDEAKLITAERPTEEMKEYRFSAKYGVEGDAGNQNSYHGLKGFLSDEFLVMGKKRRTHARSSSVYEGDEPYYFFTTVNTDEEMTVSIETGAYKPDKIWIDHIEIFGEQIRLSEGRHHILLRFPHGGRSYFVLRKSNSFEQTLPLVTNWFENTDILKFDALSENRGKYCCYRFKTPVGAKMMRVSSKIPVKAYINGNELQCIGFNEFAIDTPRSAEVTLFAKQFMGEYDTALFTEPIAFDTGEGIYDTSISPDEQGMNFYSGGISLKKSVNLTKNGKRKFFDVNTDFGCAFEIYVNESKVMSMLTKPYRCDITKYICNGDNIIEVRAFNDLHNHMKTIPTNFNEK